MSVGQKLIKRKSISSKYEVCEIGSVDVTFDISMLTKSEVVYFNATEIAKQIDKEVYDWLRQKETKEYIQTLENVNPDFKTGLDLVRTVRGKYGGTYLHKDLAIYFARWISPTFAVLCDIKMQELLKEETKRKESRMRARLEYPDMTYAIQNAHDPAKAYHYSNEANMINKIVTGMSSKQFKIKHDVEDVRDGMTMLQIQATEYLQKRNTVMIELGFEYKERKDKLKEMFANKFLLDSLIK